MSLVESKILIVESDPILRESYTKALGELDLECTFVEDGAQAVQLISELPIHLIISEWDMPSIHGIQLCKHVKTYSNKKIFFLFLTIKENEQFIESALEAGADDFITKPINPKLLARKVHTLLEAGGFLGGFKLKDVLESLPSLTAIINKQGIVVDFYKSKEFGTPCDSKIVKGEAFTNYWCEQSFTAIGNLETLKDIVHSRDTKFFKLVCPLTESRFEFRIGPLNGEYSIITVTDVTERGKELATEIDKLLIDIKKIKTES